MKKKKQEKLVALAALASAIAAAAVTKRPQATAAATLQAAMEDTTPYLDTERTRSTGQRVELKLADGTSQDAVLYFCVHNNMVVSQAYIAVELKVAPREYVEFDTKDDDYLLTDALTALGHREPKAREMLDNETDSIIVCRGMVSPRMLEMLALMAERRLEAETL